MILDCTIVLEELTINPSKGKGFINKPGICTARCTVHPLGKIIDRAPEVHCSLELTSETLEVIRKDIERGVELALKRPDSYL